MATKKAQELVAQMADYLAKRTGLTVTLGSAGDNFLLGAAAAGSAGAFIKVATIPTLASDVFGNAQAVYTPHIVQVAMEAGDDPLDAQNGVTFINSAAQLLAILGECLATGCAVDLYTQANATAPSASSITGTPAHFANLYFGVLAQQ